MLRDIHYTILHLFFHFWIQLYLEPVPNLLPPSDKGRREQVSALQILPLHDSHPVAAALVDVGILEADIIQHGSHCRPSEINHQILVVFGGFMVHSVISPVVRILVVEVQVDFEILASADPSEGVGGVFGGGGGTFGRVQRTRTGTLSIISRIHIQYLIINRLNACLIYLQCHV